MSVTSYVSSMGHPGKLLSSQVVVIQWYLLQWHMLVFVKRYRELYLVYNTEHIWTTRKRCVNFIPESISQKIVSMFSVFWLFLWSHCVLWFKFTLSSQFCKNVSHCLTNIQLTPCTCMLVISSELLSALHIQKLNHTVGWVSCSFQIINIWTDSFGGVVFQNKKSNLCIFKT